MNAEVAKTSGFDVRKDELRHFLYLNFLSVIGDLFTYQAINHCRESLIAKPWQLAVRLTVNI